MSEQAGKCGSPGRGKKRRLIHRVIPQTMYRESSFLNVLEFKTGVEVVHTNWEKNGQTCVRLLSLYLWHHTIIQKLDLFFKKL